MGASTLIVRIEVFSSNKDNCDKQFGGRGPSILRNPQYVKIELEEPKGTILRSEQMELNIAPTHMMEGCVLRCF